MLFTKILRKASFIVFTIIGLIVLIISAYLVRLIALQYKAEAEWGLAHNINVHGWGVWLALIALLCVIILGSFLGGWGSDAMKAQRKARERAEKEAKKRPEQPTGVTWNVISRPAPPRKDGKKKPKRDDKKTPSKKDEEIEEDEDDDENE